MARFEEAQGDPGRNRLGAVVGEPDHLSEHGQDVILPVERLDRIDLGTTLDQAGDVTGVGLLEHGRIEEHGGAQVAGGRRGVDRPGEALAAEDGEGA